MKGQWTVQCSSCQVCSSFVGTHWTLDSVYAAFPATPVFNMCYCAGSGRSHPAGEGESSPAHSRPFRGLSTKIIHYDCAPALILSCVFTSACVSSLYPSSHTCSQKCIIILCGCLISPADVCGSPAISGGGFVCLVLGRCVILQTWQ